MHPSFALHNAAASIGARSTARAALDIARLVHPADWARLPSSLRRRFEAGHGPASYAGAMTFERSLIGLAMAWLSKALGAPLPTTRATNTPVVVEVRPEAGGVVWSRRLGPDRFVRSVKSPGPGGTILERTDGGLGMLLDVSVDDGALIFTSTRFFLALGKWRLPIPPALTPGRCRVEHRALDDTQFRFTLTMVHPLLGTTFRQTGVFTEGQENLS